MAKAKEGKQPRSATRYSARVRLETGKVQEIGFGTDLAELKALAKKHHDEHGFDTWVWSVKSGDCVFRIARASLVQKAGAQ